MTGTSPSAASGARPGRPCPLRAFLPLLPAPPLLPARRFPPRLPLPLPPLPPRPLRSGRSAGAGCCWPGGTR
ncbi:phage DNA packaging protein J [Kitasatospora sp. NPDC127067]|uniref:phage DNA packaging protein J n=1 Tax=Kitasatospora sp. NPDC127067 TaxID=3347126 RepID=UPI003661DA6D